MEIIARDIVSTDWVTLVLMTCLGLLVVAKLLNAVKFEDFVLLYRSDKYVRALVKDYRPWQPFQLSLSVLQLLSFSLFIFLIVPAIDDTQINDTSTDFGFILLVVTVLFLVKALLERFVFSILRLGTPVYRYLLEKWSYRKYFGIVLMLLSAAIAYSVDLTPTIFTVLMVIILLLFSIYLFFQIRKYRQVIIAHPLYFILYFCTLEIAPYYILYKVVTADVVIA